MLAREKKELEIHPEDELKELSDIYEKRGLDKSLALQVATQLTSHNALEAHARDELGIYEITQAKPLQAAIASGASFIAGAILPLIVALSAPIKSMVFWQYGMSIPFLAIMGYIAARTGGSSPSKSILRVCVWGTIAMVMSAIVGHLFGVSVA